MQPENNHDIDKRLSRLYAAPVPESFETGWRADIRREESIQNMKHQNKGRIFKKLIPALCALVLVIGGLVVGENDIGSYDMTAEPSAMMNMSRSYSAASPKMAAGGYTEEIYYDEAVYESASTADSGVVTYGAVQQTDRKLVRTADLTIYTKEFDQAVEQLQNTLNSVGGYVESLYQYGESIRHMNMSLRVPSQQLDQFLASLEGTGRVSNRSESTMDMTVEYQDNQARLGTLYQKRDRLNALLEKAETVEDLIEIESAIADTQYQIDRFETSQRSIDRQVDMSAVSISLIEEEVTVVNPELTMGQRIRAGFESSVEWLGEFMRDVIVFAVMASPVAGVALAAWLVWKLIRKLKKREE